MKVGKFLAAVAILGLAGVAFGQDASPSPRPARDPNMMPLRGQIVSVATDGNIVVKTMARRGQEGTEVTVATDAKTTVSIDGKDGMKVSDLKKDLYVIITPAKGVAAKIVATTTAPTRPGRGGAGGAGGAAPGAGGGQ